MEQSDIDELKGMLRQVLERRVVSPQDLRREIEMELKALGYGSDEFKEDLAWLRNVRQTAQSSTRHAIVVFVGIVVTAAATAIWLGIKGYLTGTK